MAGDEEENNTEGEANTPQSNQGNSGGSQSSSGNSESQSSGGTQKSTQKPTEESQDGPSGTVNGADGVEVVSANWYNEMMSYGVKGKLKNTSGGKLSSVETQVHYFDSGGTRIGESMDMITDFAEDSSSTFETMGALNAEAKDVAEWELTIKVSDY